MYKIRSPSMGTDNIFFAAGVNHKIDNRKVDAGEFAVKNDDAKSSAISKGTKLFLD